MTAVQKLYRKKESSIELKISISSKEIKSIITLKEIFKEVSTKAKVITITGSEGGCGKSSILMIMGNILRHLHKKRVLVIDAHFSQYSIGIFRKKEQECITKNETSMYDFIRKSDKTAIKKQMSKTGLGPYDVIMSDENKIELDIKENVDKYDYILVDLPRDYYKENRNDIIKNFDYIFIPFNYLEILSSNEEFALELQNLRDNNILTEKNNLIYYWNLYTPKRKSQKFQNNKIKETLPNFKAIQNKMHYSRAIESHRMRNTLTAPISSYSHYGNIQNTVEEMCSIVME